MLRNVKHEAFARNLVEMTKTGGTQGNCYSKAGYRCENGAAEAAASRMLADVKNGVADRVKELMQGGVRRAEVTSRRCSTSWSWRGPPRTMTSNFPQVSPSIPLKDGAAT
jgi:hypothetical protein